MRPAADQHRVAVACVTDRRIPGDRSILEIVRSVLAGGVDLLQIREKDLGGAALLALTREVLEAAKGPGRRCRVVVNDRLDVALAAKAAGVHLPAEGLPIEAARRAAGKTFLIGRSVHSPAEARQAERAGADYLFFGPIFETPAKVPFGPPQGVAALRKVVEAVRVPVWAIGGINPATAGELRGIPVAGVAAIAAFMGAADPAAAVRALRAALEGKPPA